MVQDMYDPEFYLGAYEVVDKNTGQAVSVWNCPLGTDLAYMT